MAKHFYENVVGGEDLKLIADPRSFNETIDIAQLSIVTEYQALSDDARTEAAQCLGISLEEYDAALEDDEWTIRDRLDYYTLYSNRTQELTVRDGAWFSPVAIQSVLSEDVGNEASKSIDGNTVTFFRDSTNHQHVIVFKLRDYPKKVSKIRFWYGSGESARERLNNIDIHAAKGLANIDNAENILETGINLTWTAGGGVWVEHDLASKKNRARYVKLVIDDTDNPNNQCQIREFEVWVETREAEG